MKVSLLSEMVLGDLRVMHSFSKNSLSMYQKSVVKTWFINNGRQRQKALCSYQRF